MNRVPNVHLGRPYMSKPHHRTAAGASAAVGHRRVSGNIEIRGCGSRAQPLMGYPGRTQPHGSLDQNTALARKTSNRLLSRLRGSNGPIGSRNNGALNK
jgi:hypothetical protein